MPDVAKGSSGKRKANETQASAPDESAFPEQDPAADTLAAGAQTIAEGARTIAEPAPDNAPAVPKPTPASTKPAASASGDPLFPAPSRVRSAAQSAQSSSGRLPWHARFPAGTRIGPYEVVKPLGRGAMGMVLLVKHLDLNREVALKILTGVADDDSVERFRREAEAVAHLDHANIVRVYDRGETADGLHYYAMEYVKGASLDALLKRERKSYVEAARIMAKICHALDYAHSRGVLHRDIKPANILIDEKGTPRLTDFGLARIESKATLTQEGTIVGTPLYLAPELARGDRATRKADIYSAGATLYELATGKPPYEGREARQILGKLLDGPPRAPQSIDPHIPEDLVTIIGRAMARDPDKRYPSPRNLAIELERFEKQRPLMIEGRVTGAWAGETTREKLASRFVLIAAGAVLIAAVGGTVLLAERKRRKAEEEKRALQRQLDKMKREGAGGQQMVRPGFSVTTQPEQILKTQQERDTKARMELQRLPPANAVRPSADAYTLGRRGREALRAGNRTEAAGLIRQALGLMPQDIALRLDYGRAILADEPDAAELELSMVVEHDEAPPELRAAARLERGRLYRDRDGMVWRELARLDFEAASSVEFPGKQPALVERAWMRVKAGDAAGARKLLAGTGAVTGDDLVLARLVDAHALKLEGASHEALLQALERARGLAKTDAARARVDQTWDQLIK